MSYYPYYYPVGNNVNIENILQNNNVILNENNSLKQEIIAINGSLKDREEQIDLLLRTNMRLIQTTKTDEKEYLKKINLFEEEIKNYVCELDFCKIKIEDQNKQIFEKKEIIFKLENQSKNEDLSQTTEKIKRAGQNLHGNEINDFVQKLQIKEIECEELMKKHQEFQIFHEQELSKLNQNLNNYQESFSLKENEINQFKKDKESLKISLIKEKNDALAILNNEITTLTEKNRNLQNSYSVSLKDFEACNRELNALKENNNELRKKNEEHLVEEENLNMNLQILKKDNENLKKNLDSQNVEITNLTSKITSLNEDLNKIYFYENEMKKQYNEITSKMKLIEKYKMENVNLMLKLEEINQEVLVKNKEISSNHERINYLKEFTENLQTEIQTKIINLEKIEVELIASSSDLAAKHSELLETRILNDNLMINNNQLKNELLIKNEQIEKLLFVLKEGELEIQNLKNQMIDLNQEILVKSKEITSNHERINYLEEYTDNIQSETQTKVAKLGKIETELITSSSNFDNIQNQLEHLTTVLTAKNSELLETMEIKDKLIINSNQLKDDLLMKNEEIEKLLVDLNEGKSGMINLSHQFEDLNQEIFVKNKEISSYQERINDLEEFTENLQKEIQMKTDKFYKIEAELLTSSSNFVNIQNQLDHLTTVLTAKNSELLETMKIKDNLIMNSNQLKDDLLVKNEEIEKLLVVLNEEKYEKQNLIDRINDLNQLNSKLKEQREGKKRELENFIVESSNAGQELIDLKEDLNIAKDRLQSKEKELESSIRKHNEILTNFTIEKNNFEQEQQRLLQKLDEKTFRLQEKSEKIIDLENALQIIESELKNMKNKCELLTFEIEKMTVNNEDLSKKLIDKESEILIIKLESSFLQEKQGEHQNDNISRLIDLEKKILLKDAEISRVKNEFNSISIEIEKMSDNNNALSDQLKNRDIQIENLHAKIHSLENECLAGNEQAKEIHESLIEIVDKKYLHYEKEPESFEEKEADYEVIQKHEGNQKKEPHSIDLIENCIREFIKMKENNDEVQINEKLEEEMFKILEERNQIIKNLKKKIEDKNNELEEKEVENSKYKEKLDLKAETIKSYKQIIEERDGEIKKLQVRLETIKTKFTPSPKQK